jgi:hypothetical protein
LIAALAHFEATEAFHWWRIWIYPPLLIADLVFPTSVALSNTDCQSRGTDDVHMWISGINPLLAGTKVCK